MGRVLYKEEQKFGSISLYLAMGLIYTGVVALATYAAIKQFMYNEQWSSKPMSDNSLILMLVLMLVILVGAWLLLFGSKLIIKIEQNKIVYSFPPFINKELLIEASQIESYRLRKYQPIKEYGGWGIRKSNKKYGDAFNVKGSIGLQLVLKNKKRLLFGTQRPEAIKTAMNRMMGSGI